MARSAGPVARGSRFSPRVRRRGDVAMWRCNTCSFGDECLRMTDAERRSVFALVGAAGYVARKHVDAIKAVGGELASAYDVHDSVGYLDQYNKRCRFVRDEGEFENILDLLMDLPEKKFVVICSPTDAHLKHIRLALSRNIDVICEKPLVPNRNDLAELLDQAAHSTARLLPVMQLRRHSAVRALRSRVHGTSEDHVFEVNLQYLTPRGPWYRKSWKSDPRRSGGLAVNIGIHIWDLIRWIFGPADAYEVSAATTDVLSGTLVCRRARVRWELSTSTEGAGPVQWAQPRRILEVDDTAIDLSEITGLHVEEYRGMMAGEFCPLEEVAKSLQLSFAIADAARLTSDRRLRGAPE